MASTMPHGTTMLNATLTIVACAVLLEPPTFANDRFHAADRVHNLRTVATTLHLDLIDNAPRALFRKGPCVIIAGTFIPSSLPDQPIPWDFRIERRIATSRTSKGTAPKWTEVPIKSAISVLEHAPFAEDPIDKRHRKSVFTMPLPALHEAKWTAVNAACGQADLLRKHPNAILFRFVDFTATPEIDYEYRVQLKFLEKAQRKRISGPFSTISAPVSSRPAQKSN